MRTEEARSKLEYISIFCYIYNKLAIGIRVLQMPGVRLQYDLPIDVNSFYNLLLPILFLNPLRSSRLDLYMHVVIT